MTNPDKVALQQKAVILLSQIKRRTKKDSCDCVEVEDINGKKILVCCPKCTDERNKQTMKLVSKA